MYTAPLKRELAASNKKTGRGGTSVAKRLLLKLQLELYDSIKQHDGQIISLLARQLKLFFIKHTLICKWSFFQWRTYITEHKYFNVCSSVTNCAIFCTALQLHSCSNDILSFVKPSINDFKRPVAEIYFKSMQIPKASLHMAI